LQAATDLELGTTEYILISLWFFFTTGVFTLLYKITKEADETCEAQLKQAEQKKYNGLHFGQVRSES